VKYPQAIEDKQIGAPAITETASELRESIHTSRERIEDSEPVLRGKGESTE
jgi:hypothetical protein